MTNTELMMFRGILQNEDYYRRVMPHLKVEYFQNNDTLKVLFEIVAEYSSKYNTVPSRMAIDTMMENRAGIRESTEKSLASELDVIYSESFNEDLNYAVDSAEKFCQETAVFNAIQESIQILDGESKKLTKNAIPQLLQQALSVVFNTSVGHDYFEDAALRFDSYHDDVERIPFSISLLNKITKRGLPKKTMACIIAPTGVGKSTIMCDFATDNIRKGKNVLYITLEMSEERISERIDANLLDIDLDQLANMSKERYLRKITAAREKCPGKLIVKEYPTGEAGANHFRYLLQELKTKKNFVPDVIYIDYLNLCSSTKIKGRENTYVLIKGIAEELRALAVEQNVLIITASQTNRNGQGASDYDLSDVSESHGLAMTCDFILAVISTDELEKSKRLRFKQFKNRFGSVSDIPSFLVGIDRARMKLYDIDNQFASEGPPKAAVSYSTPVPVQPERKVENFFSTGKKDKSKAKKPLMVDEDSDFTGVIDIMNIKPVIKPGYENPLEVSDDDVPPWDI